MKKGRDDWAGVSLSSPTSAPASAYPASTSESKCSDRNSAGFPLNMLLLCRVGFCYWPHHPRNHLGLEICVLFEGYLQPALQGLVIRFGDATSAISLRVTPNVSAKRDLRPSPSLPFHRWGNWSPRGLGCDLGEIITVSRFLACKRGITQWAS